MLSERMLYTVLWLLPVFVPAAIAFRICYLRLFRDYPLCLAYLILQSARSVVELTLRDGSYRRLFNFYWTAEAAVLVLNFAVLYEIGKHLLHSYPSLRRQLSVALPWVVIAILTASTIVSALQPNRGDRWLIALILLLEKLSRVVEATLLCLLLLWAAFFKLRWKQPSFGIAMGFGLYASVYVGVVAMREHLGSGSDDLFGLVGSIAYVLATFIWAASFWQRQEAPQRLAIPLHSSPARSEIAVWNRTLGELLRR